MGYYLKNYPAPVFCFTPDAEFPVCNGEKGHFGAELVSPVCNGEIKEFEGGVANNAVPDRASALVETDITKLKNAPNITLGPSAQSMPRPVPAVEACSFFRASRKARSASLHRPLSSR